jgi:hypothetical protein
LGHDVGDSDPRDRAAEAAAPRAAESDHRRRRGRGDEHRERWQHQIDGGVELRVPARAPGDSRPDETRDVAPSEVDPPALPPFVLGARRLDSAGHLGLDDRLGDELDHVAAEDQLELQLEILRQMTRQRARAIHVCSESHAVAEQATRPAEAAPCERA